MRTVKESMKNFFTAILCFLMNLVPGKKFWTMVNAGVNAKTVVSIKNSRKSGQNTNDNVRNRMETKGKTVFYNWNNHSDYKQKYVAYLYDYVDYLLINKNSIKKWDNKVSTIKYEDTG